MRLLGAVSLLVTISLPSFSQTKPTQWDGWWVGNSTQGQEIRINVKRGKIDLIEGQYSPRQCIPNDPANWNRFLTWSSSGRAAAAETAPGTFEIEYSTTATTITRLSIEFAPDNVLRAKLVLIPHEWHGVKPPINEPCELGTWEGKRVSEAAFARQESARWKVYLTIGSVNGTCDAFTERKAPVVLPRGTDSITYRVGWTGPRPLVQVTGPWGSTNWKDVSCSLPSGSTVTTVRRADGKSLPPGTYVVNAGGTKATVLIK